MNLNQENRFYFWAGLIRAWGDTHEWIKGHEHIIFGSTWEVLWFHALNESKPWASLIMLSICLTFYPEVCAAVSKALSADWNMDALPNYYFYIRSCKSLYSGWHWQLSQPYVTCHTKSHGITWDAIFKRCFLRCFSTWNDKCTWSYIR